MVRGQGDRWPSAGSAMALVPTPLLRGCGRVSLDVEPRCTEAVVEHDRVEGDVEVAAREGKYHEDGIVLLNQEERPADAEAEIGYDCDQGQPEVVLDTPVEIPHLETRGSDWCWYGRGEVGRGRMEVGCGEKGLEED